MTNAPPRPFKARSAGLPRPRPRPRYGLRIEGLEDRTLLSLNLVAANPAEVVGPVQPTPSDLAPGSSSAGTLGNGGVAFFRVTIAEDGRLTATVHAVGFSTRLSLLAADGGLLAQSDSQTTNDPDGLIVQHVVPGDYLLRVDALGTGGEYVISTSFDSAISPLMPLQPGGQPISLVTADLNGDGIPDLVAVNNFQNQIAIFLGLGDGTFSPPQLISVGSTPSWIVAGDFNGDGKVDLALANLGEDEVSVLLGNGDGTFGPEQTFPTGTGATSIAAADLEGNGKLDLVTTNSVSDDVSVLMGNGDGTFRAPLSLKAGQTPWFVTAADLDGDGRPDLVVGDYGSNDVAVIRNLGGGSFAPAVRYPAGLNVESVAVADFNGDGVPDIATGNFGSNDVSVLMGNGDGTFRPQVRFAAGTNPFVITADLNHDGHPDLLTANYGSNDVSVLLNSGNGTFLPQTRQGVGQGPIQIAVTDLNGDGRPDLVSGDYLSETVTVLAGNGDGTFRSMVPPATPVNPNSLVIGDFNGDGIPDIALANETTNDVSILLGRPDGTFRLPIRYAVGAGPESLVVGDFNHDGHLDLAVATYLNNSVEILMGRGDGTFASPVSLPVGNRPYYLIAGDFNGDGVTDLATANFGSNDVSVLLGNRDGTFRSETRIPVGVGPVALVAADFNDDGRTDLAVANSTSNDVSLLLGNGDGTFRPQARYLAGPNPYGIATADFNGDGHLDLAVADYLGAEVSVLLGKGDGTFGDASEVPVGGGPYPIVAADLNGDGRADLVVGNFDTNDVSVLIGKGNGTFDPEERLSGGGGQAQSGLVVADVNGDGKPDILTANYGTNDVSVYLGRGDGTFADPSLFPEGTDVLPAATADLDGDGVPDLVTADTSDDTITVHMGEGNGLFRTGQTLAVGPRPSSLTLADLNGDGRLDLVVSDEGGEVSILLGNGDGTFTPAVNIFVSGSPGDIIAADFNGDGHLDLALTDAANNSVVILPGRGDGTFGTPIQLPVGEEPVALAAADLDGDGHLDLVVADRSGGDLSLLWGLGGDAFRPDQRLEVGGSPSAVIIADFNGDGRPDLAVTNQTGGTVTVLLATPGGKFSPGRSYPTGNGPVSLVAADLNGDGHLDLAVADADSADVALLRNTGNGTFVSEGKLDLGDSPDFLLTADFNDDGLPDLAAPSIAANVVKLFLGEADFHFATPQATSSPLSNNPVLVNWDDSTAPDIAIVDNQGRILLREARAGLVGQYDPPVVLNPGPEQAAKDLAVVKTPRGVVLAALDSRRSAITLYSRAPDGSYVATNGPVVPGQLLSRIVAGDLDGTGLDDLIVTAAGSDAIFVFYQDASGDFTRSSGPLAVGVGPSDVVLVPGSGGLEDLVVSNLFSGDVSVLHNLGGGRFAPEERFRAGIGPFSTVTLDGKTVTQAPDEIVGLVAGLFSEKGPVDLAVLRRDSDSFDVLQGLSSGGYTNPISSPAFQTGVSPTVIVAGRFTGGPQLDLAILDEESDDVSIYFGDGKGGFVAGPRFDAGNNPTGLTLADVNGDGKLDLLIGNEFGDVMILSGDGQGGFSPYQRIDRSITLAVSGAGNPATTTFLFSDRSEDQISVEGPGSIPSVLAGRDNGVIAPGQVVLADLNGDGIPDAIVINSGGNNVLVYPGLPGGGFGPELDGGRGFFTGTDPVGVTVADVNGDGRPDLVVANKGSNDVSILLNRKGSDGFTFVPGPRLRVGAGPVATVVRDVNGDGRPDILVSDSLSDDVMVLPGIGGGFFNDRSPIELPVGINPGPLFVGNFNGSMGVAVVNSGSNDVTVITDFLGQSPAYQTVETGGIDPVAAFLEGSEGGFDSLVVANNGDGRIALLEGGASGLALDPNVISDPNLPNPTSLAFATLSGGQLEFYAATEGLASASLLAFTLEDAAITPSAGPAEDQGVASLVPLRDSSLALVAAFLTLMIESPSNETLASSGEAESLQATSFLATDSVTTSPAVPTSTETREGSDEPPPVVAAPIPETPAGWERFVIGLDEDYERFREETRGRFEGDPSVEPDAVEGSTMGFLLDLEALEFSVPKEPPGSLTNGTGTSEPDRDVAPLEGPAEVVARSGRVVATLENTVGSAGGTITTFSGASSLGLEKNAASLPAPDQVRLNPELEPRPSKPTEAVAFAFLVAEAAFLADIRRKRPDVRHSRGIGRTGQ